MPYTLWSHDRLLGESELDYISNTDERLMGDFFPTVYGESRMPVLTGVSRALLEVKRARVARGSDDADARVDHATEYADVAEANTRFDELELQLRGPDGAVIPTDSLHVQDTQLMLQWSDEPLEEIDAYDELMFDTESDAWLMDAVENDLPLVEEMLEKNVAEARAAGHAIPDHREERPFPRYQLQVFLTPLGG